MTAALPVDEIRSEVLSHWRHQGCLVQSPPGSGKTTRLPLWFLDQTDQEILLLLPRRLSVRLAAHQLAKQLGEPVGHTVGYSLRDDTRRSQQTRLTVTTYGAFLRRLAQDPELTGVSTVILDEFHERQLDQDTTLTLLHSCRTLFRPELKWLLMSATLALDVLQQRLGLPRVTSDGQLYPLTLHYRPQRSSDWQSAVLAAVEEGKRLSEGHILVFLPGLREIEAIKARLPGHDQPFIVHSQVNNDDLMEQLGQSDAAIILSTNLAESSVTLPGVRCVVDLGLERYARVDPHTDLTELITRRISKSSAEQRAGRAARLGPGQCFRLWSETDHNALAPDQPAEITQADLKPLVLTLADWGLTHLEALWITPPNPGRWQLAVEQLIQWQALDHSGTQLTPHGQTLLRLGLTPALAHLVSLAQKDANTSDALWFAALLSLEISLPEPMPNMFIRRVAQGDASLAREARRLARTLNTALRPQATLLPDTLLVRALPHRLVQVDVSMTARLASGRQVRCRTEAPKPGWYLLLNGQDQGHSILAHALWPLSEEAITSSLSVTETVRYRADHDRFESQRRIGPFPLTTQPAQPDLAEKVAAWADYLSSIPLERWPNKDLAKPWLSRYRLLQRQLPDQWPQLPEPADFACLAEPYLNGLSRLAELKTTEILTTWLGYNKMKAFNHLCPTHWTAPSGRELALQYDSETGRVSADMKLQEAFGLPLTPTLINAAVPLTLNLQAPNGRILASVTDLPHFWTGIYPQIRKEMRGRYSKHPWPDNPITATATHATNRQLAGHNP